MAHIANSISRKPEACQTVAGGQRPPVAGLFPISTPAGVPEGLQTRPAINPQSRRDDIVVEPSSSQDISKPRRSGIFHITISGRRNVAPAEFKDSQLTITINMPLTARTNDST